MCVLAVLSTLNSNSVVRLCADAVWANTRSITHVVNVWGGHSICHQVTCCCYVTRRPDGTSDPDCLQKREEKIEQRDPQEQLERAVVRVICGFGLVSAEFLEYQVLTGLLSQCYLGCLRLTI